MQKKTIDHPFHKISFDIDESKSWTARDEKLLNTYLQLHDNEKQRHEAASGLRKQFIEMDKRTETLRKELNGVKKKITAIRDAADHIIAQINLHVPKAVEKFTEQVNETNEAIQEHHAKMQEFEKEVKELSDLKNKFMDEEEEETLWERLSELKITYAHDSRLATDYVSFDDDEQRFREKASFMSRQNDQYMDYCNRAVDNYNRLLLELTAQYDVWNEFGRRMKLIEHITGRNSGFMEIGTN